MATVTRISVWRQLPQPFLHRQARSAGLAARTIAAAVERGHLTRLGDGLYALADDWDDLTESERHLGLCRAALELLPRAVLSHASAAVAWGLPKPSRPVDKALLVSRDDDELTTSTDGWKAVLHGGLTDADWTTTNSLRVTTPARTVADVLRVGGLKDGLAMADAAVRAGIMTSEELGDARTREKGWPGVRTIDDALQLIDGRRESWLESASVAVAWRNGYSKPVAQVSIHTAEGRFVGRCDHLWHEAGVIGEADGLGKYRGDFDEGGLSADQMARRILAERDRERAFEALGFGVARWGTIDLREGGSGLVRALVEARRRARPREIQCLWRLNQGEVLRPWSEFADWAADQRPDAA
jgi:hypothetical protein